MIDSNRRYGFITTRGASQVGVRRNFHARRRRAEIETGRGSEQYANIEDPKTVPNILNHPKSFM
jgi:hypothetical protein